MNRKEAIQCAENDSEIQAVVVTADGWIAVTNEATAGAAQSLFDRALRNIVTNNNQTMSENTSTGGSGRLEPEEYPSEETIYGFHGSVVAAGLKIVDSEGVPVDADGLRVALYEHWGILEDGDGYADVRFALEEMGEVAGSIQTEGRDES